ncbi:MAG TPA: MASE1 domain-containing protein [Gaiellaceae bacterium]|nr:MASE1 domain-containing protein [Gaiellaceae bacterium]
MSISDATHLEERPRWVLDGVELRSVVNARYLAAVAAFFGTYYGAAKFGLELDVAHGVITPVWAPSGISLAVLFLFGLRYWPAVALGAFAANATSGLSVALAAGVSVGNTLAALAGALALRRLALRPSLARIQDVLAFTGAALGSTLISATSGTSLLYATDHIQSYGSNWVLWWFGDSAGNLLVAPLILVLIAGRHVRPTRRQALEGAVLLSGLGALGAVVFFAGEWRYPYVLFPFLIWAPLRLRQPGAACASFLVGALATLGAAHGDVPIGASATEGVQILQALICVVAISMLIVGATLAEREATNQALAYAQELTHIGSWEWDIRTNRVCWSDELFRIYGFEPRSTKIDYGFFLERVHPDDRDRIDAQIRAAYESRAPFDFEHRIVLPDGRERLLQAHGRVEVDESDTPVRMLGTGQDITQQRDVDRLRDGILATVSHELRTPLTSVLGFAVTLKERRGTLSDETAAELVDHIAVEGERLNSLLGDLLDLDRHRRGATAPTRKRADLADIARRIAERYTSRGRDIAVDAEPLVATVDAALVERIVENLLANAVKHTPNGTPVAVSVRASGGDVLIVVDDGGPGVPAPLRRSIFEIFDRGGKDPSTTAGTGIGLSIVAQFAAVHGGRAWVEEAPGGGASFRVLLPGCVDRPA